MMEDVISLDCFVFESGTSMCECVGAVTLCR